MLTRLTLAPALALCCYAQEEGKPAQNSEGNAVAGDVAAQEAVPPGGKRIFGVLPNYRTADRSLEGTVLSAPEKLNIARKDSFDYPMVGLASVLAGLNQWADQQPSFGQGLKGYTHRLATNYADQAIGNIFSEGVFPALLHEDPRYFRRATGTTWGRAWYAASRVFVTHKDGGAPRFNYSEWIGNASAVAISNSYYPDGRTFRENGEKLLEQVGTDAASQVLKEFWPDIKRKLFHKSPDR